jgi:hypothetical protein
MFTFFEDAVANALQGFFNPADVADMAPMNLVWTVVKMIVASPLQAAQHGVDMGDLADVSVNGLFFRIGFHGFSLSLQSHERFIRGTYQANKTQK